MIVKVWLKFKEDDIECICPYNKKKGCSEVDCHPFVAKLTEVPSISIITDEVTKLSKAVANLNTNFDRLYKRIR